jgi:hypothetical protein
MSGIEKALEGSTVTGIYCSSCDFLIEPHSGEVSNKDLFDAAGLHNAKFHGPDSKTPRTSYDIRATKGIVIAKPVTSIKLELK